MRAYGAAASVRSLYVRRKRADAVNPAEGRAGLVEIAGVRINPIQQRRGKPGWVVAVKVLA